jgi:ABC-type multidrug transport system ATPase subunit
MRLDKISKRYENLLYEDLSYTFEPNNVYSIFGSNGAGKEYVKYTLELKKGSV